jgi:hypothetical protein
VLSEFDEDASVVDDFMQEYDWRVHFESACRVAINAGLEEAFRGKWALKVSKVRGGKRDEEVKRGWLLSPAHGAKTHVSVCHNHVSFIRPV